MPQLVKGVIGCAGLEGPLIGLFENAAMIVLLAALMLFTAFWLPFTIGRWACSKLSFLLVDDVGENAFGGFIKYRLHLAHCCQMRH